MSADYKPGTVAAIRDSKSEPEWRAVKDDKGWSSLDPSIGWVPDFDVIDVRPLVVLDEPDFYYETAVPELRAAAQEGGRSLRLHRILNSIADQIETQTRPPEPPEPQGLGAVVEDAEGVLWTRCSRVPGHPWQDADDNHFGTAYEAIDVVRVLSEGVQP